MAGNQLPHPASPEHLCSECRTTGYRMISLFRTPDAELTDLQSVLHHPEFFHQLPLQKLLRRTDQVLLPVSRVPHVSRDIFVFEGNAPRVGIIPVDGFHFHQLTTPVKPSSAPLPAAAEPGSRPDGFDSTNNFQEVRAHAVHFVNERNARNFAFVCLTPYGFARLRPNTTNCAVTTLPHHREHACNALLR